MTSITFYLNQTIYYIPSLAVVNEKLSINNYLLTSLIIMEMILAIAKFLYLDNNPGEFPIDYYGEPRKRTAPNNYLGEALKVEIFFNSMILFNAIKIISPCSWLIRFCTSVIFATMSFEP